jgi:lysophospholipase L1-like esterase
MQPIICLLLGAILTSSVQAAEHFWDEIPLSPSTTRPAVVLDDYWNSEFQRINREVSAAQNTSLVFFGDSITWSWSLGAGTGRAVWQKEFSAYNPINMGNSGDITPVMLHRVTRGNLDFPVGQDPSVAVVLCGINNFIVAKSAGGKETWALGPDCPPEEIAQGQRAIAQVFRRRLPKTRVILMALLPVANSANWEKCRRVNAISASLSRDPNQVVFVNLQDRFLLPDGTMNRALYTDGVHLNQGGYQAWADGLAPIIGEFMKAPPLVPAKIMLIGGSLTEAPDSARSYRCYLDGMLRRKGHLIDFVGSRRKHNNDGTEPESYQFDPDHEGHWGKDSAWMAENIDRLLERNVPDVAVIDLGAEDIMASLSAPDSLTDGIVRNIDRVIKALRAKNGKVKIAIAKVLPVRGREAICDQLNQKISLLVRSSATAPQPVVVVETTRDLDGNQDLGQDDALPNAGGAKKIAGTILDAVHPLLEDLQNSPSK